MAKREMIKAKQENRPPREIEEAPPASNVINLMDALKRSVKGGSAEEPKAEKAPKSESGGTRKTARKTKSAGKAAKKSARKSSGRRKAA